MVYLFRLRTAVNRLWQVARLNARVAGLALRGRWMSPAHVARGYDTVAPTYRDSWQQRLAPITDELLQRLLSLNSSPIEILDLGAGNGCVAKKLAAQHPNARVTAVDVSSEMLCLARSNAPPNLVCAQADMLDFLRSYPAGGADWLVSTWALGYSYYTKLFPLCSRALKPGGTFAFIVNYADTLRPVFAAFSKCMFRFPECVQLAAWPRFPRTWQALEKSLRQSGFTILHHADGNHPIMPPPGEMLPWLRQTGILSGFDQMMDLNATPGPAAFMEHELQQNRKRIFHHYCLCIARKAPERC